jgi:membrane peptidoglycan carboxypeptidase
MALSGRGSIDATFRFDSSAWDEAQLDLDVAVGRCKVERDADLAPVGRLLLPDIPYRTYPAGDAAAPGPERLLGPGNPSWRPLGRVSPRLGAAFLAAEDARFYSHHGFDLEYIRRALARDLDVGRFERGASTITQQLVKNVFLDPSRSFARKLEEAVLTWRVEQIVPKARILELYLNAIELGPGVYGVAEAARRYFDEEPDELDPLACAHLALLAPDPRGRWRALHAAPPSADWLASVHALLGVMRRAGRITDEELAAARARPLRFAFPLDDPSLR